MPSAVRNAAAFAVERHVRYLSVGDQHVGAFDDVAAVPFDQTLRGTLDHVDSGFVRRHVVAEPRSAEHQIVTQVVGLGELRVVVGADRLDRADRWKRRSD